MTVTLVQRAIDQLVGSTASNGFTLATAPVAGNLLVFVSYQSAGATQSGATSTGFQQDIITDTTVSASTVIMSRIADGTEGTGPFTLQWASATTGTVMSELMELNPGTGMQWAATRPAASGKTSTGTSALTGTVTATGATTGPSYAVAGLGIGGAAVLGHTWTNGFTWDAGNVSSGRFEVAVKESTGAETLSTNETWDTSRVFRLALASYALEVPPFGPPTGLSATAISSSAIDVSWSAVSGASSYDVERDGVIVASSFVGTTYHDTGLTTGQTYSYRVRSVV